MKATHTLIKVTLPMLLLSIALLFTSCSKQEEVAPAKKIIEKISLADSDASDAQMYPNTFTDEFGNGCVVEAGGGANHIYVDRIYFDSGTPIYGLLLPHRELTDRCTIQLWQETPTGSGWREVLVARHVQVLYTNPPGNNGRGEVRYHFPTLVPPGNYRLYLSVESADRSFTVGTTGDPSTYSYVIHDNITITHPVSPTFHPTGLLQPSPNVYDARIDLYHTLNWDPANFAGNNLRAFVKYNDNSIHQLTPASDPNIYFLGGPITFSHMFDPPVFFNNTGTTSVLLTEPGQRLHLGEHRFFIDDFDTTYSGGDTSVYTF